MRNKPFLFVTGYRLQLGTHRSNDMRPKPQTPLQVLVPTLSDEYRTVLFVISEIVCRDPSNMNCSKNIAIRQRKDEKGKIDWSIPTVLPMYSSYEH